jgi:hypothetical protein
MAIIAILLAAVLCTSPPNNDEEYTIEFRRVWVGAGIPLSAFAYAEERYSEDLGHDVSVLDFNDRRVKELIAKEKQYDVFARVVPPPPEGKAIGVLLSSDDLIPEVFSASAMKETPGFFKRASVNRETGLLTFSLHATTLEKYGSTFLVFVYDEKIVESLGNREAEQELREPRAAADRPHSPGRRDFRGLEVIGKARFPELEREGQHEFELEILLGEKISEGN